jgi:hypothetical protein
LSGESPGRILLCDRPGTDVPVEEPVFQGNRDRLTRNQGPIFDRKEVFLVRLCETALAGSALVLVMASPLSAASSGTPCNATGALGTTMGGCSKPPTPSKAGSGLSGVRPVFTAPMRFKEEHP